MLRCARLCWRPMRRARTPLPPRPGATRSCSVSRSVAAACFCSRFTRAAALDPTCSGKLVTCCRVKAQVRWAPYLTRHRRMSARHLPRHLDEARSLCVVSRGLPSSGGAADARRARARRPGRTSRPRCRCRPGRPSSPRRRGARCARATARRRRRPRRRPARPRPVSASHLQVSSGCRHNGVNSSSAELYIAANHPAQQR